VSDESPGSARLPIVVDLMTARSRRATTHLRAVWELPRAQRSSRWLNHGELALLFAGASFGRPYPGESPPRRTRSRVAPRSLHLHSRYACARGGRVVALADHSGFLTPRASNSRSGWRSLDRHRAVLWHSLSRERHRLAGSSRTAATAPRFPSAPLARRFRRAWFASPVTPRSPGVSH